MQRVEVGLCLRRRWHGIIPIGTEVRPPSTCHSREIRDGIQLPRARVIDIDNDIRF